MSENVLHSPHWSKAGARPKFSVHLAANNSPGMSISTGHVFNSHAILLIREAYDSIAFDLHLRPFPISNNSNRLFGGPDKRAMESFQRHFGLGVDGVAGAETLRRLDAELIARQQRSHPPVFNPKILTRVNRP